MARQAIGKLSTKIIMGGKMPKAPEDDSVIYLYDVIGVARATRLGESNFGAWVSFLGPVRAKRLSDGVVFGGDEMFLPGMAGARVQGHLEQLTKSGGGEVEYGYRVGIRRDDRQAYGYHVEPLFDEENGDPLAALEKRASPAPALIASSKKKATA